MKREKQIPFRIGEATPRCDARTKVTGQERYAADYYGDHFFWAGVKRAGIPHGKLIKVHTEDAKKLKGVVAVLTSEDVPGSNRVGIIRGDQPVLADKKICYAGDPLALVIAENKETLQAALALITFDHEPLPGVFDVEEALRKDAPLVHEDSPGGNLLRLVSVETGKGASAFDECDVIVEGVFETPFQEHAYLETEAGWAYLDDSGQLVVVTATQTPFRDRNEMAPALGIDVEKIRVIVPYLGGAFGGKDGITIQCLLGLSALHTGGVPVKMWWGREESFLASVKRLSARMRYRLGVKRDGTFHALECRAYFDTGAYAGLGETVMTLGLEHAGSAYRIPNVSIKGSCVYTNNAVGGPFRGFGVTQVTAAMERIVDMAAQKLSVDPLAIRRVNAVERGDKNCIGVTLTHSTGIKKCLAALSDHPLWREREGWKMKAGQFKKRGVGIACMAHAMGYPAVVPDFANAKIEFTGEGRFRIYAGIVDMGQGNASTYAHIAGALLGQEASAFELIQPDTERTLPSGSSSASRTTYVYGNALVIAVEDLKKKILDKALRLFSTAQAEELMLVPGGIRHRKDKKKVSLKEVAGLFDESERFYTAYFRSPAATEMLDRIYLGPHIIFSYGAHLAYVEIDTLTGCIEVTGYLAVTDAGNVINPQAYEQQIQGGIAQGIGFALSEDYKAANGHADTNSLATYIIPTAMDVPDMLSVAADNAEETGPFGMKGIGEISISGPVPAIANAVADACGIRIGRNPITAENIFRALWEQNDQERPR
ncbi:MAG TPA: xanthine dehydrogenase family protein molybdopterin-binding subunit [Syntrophorhabdaceae bacterium]|nr:xanthine dehydrogenase family protein molybdopterin-binding subunit [Syntrophorhabdaceae bacterium]